MNRIETYRAEARRYGLLTRQIYIRALNTRDPRLRDYRLDRAKKCSEKANAARLMCLCEIETELLDGRE